MNLHESDKLLTKWPNEKLRSITLRNRLWQLITLKVYVSVGQPSMWYGTVSVTVKDPP